ncbi:MAG: transketolase [Candidatus Promineifilaceae bacterium]
MNNRDNLYVNTLRFLAVDAVQKAGSGHPGLPLGSAAMMYTLWTRFLHFNPRDPHWPDRDRFILSAGHGSALLYAMLHLTGYDLSLDELKRFRQWDSRTPGHPEFGRTPGVEATTGPLGQGLANAVGMAIAEAALAARFNRPGYDIVDHHTYALVSDGDLMEGISSEAASLAGHLQLGKLIVLYANNFVTIEGSTNLAFSEDRASRFAAFGWHVQHVEDSNDITALAEAIAETHDESDRPSLLVVDTHIGYGSPHKQDTAAAHGEPLGEEELRLTKENLGWPVEPSFLIPDEALAHYRQALERGANWQADWRTLFEDYSKVFPDLAVEFHRVIQGNLPDDWDRDLPRFLPDGKPIATRTASGSVINALAARLPELIGGAADLAPSTRTLIENGEDFEAGNYSGRNFHFGIREHAMGAVLNGLALHGGVVPYGATFLIFSDYMRPPMRLAAMNGLPVIYVFTHDSIALGEDGPTHQPVEQLLGLRSIPNMTVIRPADANETAAAWQAAIQHRDGPVALILTRQKLPVLDPGIHSDISLGVRCGGYILARESAGVTPDIILIATGSEVHLALPAQAHLASQGIQARVVSMPSWELFQRQPVAYRNRVLLPGVPQLGIEAGRTLGWQTYAGTGITTIGVDRFGASAPGSEVTTHYGLTVDRVRQRAEALLRAPANLGNSLLVAVDDTTSSLAMIVQLALSLPDPAKIEATLMHYLSPVYWEYGGGDSATANILEHEALAQELAEQHLTATYFAQAREILENAGVAATHIHVKEEWDANDVAGAILSELQQGAFTAIVIGRHHHNSLARLFGLDLAAILHKHAPDIVIWTIETYPGSNETADLERKIEHV